MIKFTEYGIMTDEETKNVDIYAYYLDETDWLANKDAISVAVTYENSCYKIEIVNHDSEVIYSTYVENGVEVNRVINILDAVLGVTTRWNNIDD